jgi:uncharacterized protein (TIGR02246 family)
MDRIDAPAIARNVMDAYRAAVYAKDVDAFVALYDDDCVVFDMWGAWSYAGISAWRGMVVGWFGSLGGERAVVEATDVHARGEHELIGAHAFLRYKAVSEDGRELRAMTNRLTWTLVRRHDGWRIVHEHSSAPIDFESFKPILER